jgi:hypothetical protein
VNCQSTVDAKSTGRHPDSLLLDPGSGPRWRKGEDLESLKNSLSPVEEGEREKKREDSVNPYPGPVFWFLWLYNLAFK